MDRPVTGMSTAGSVKGPTQLAPPREGERSLTQVIGDREGHSRLAFHSFHAPYFLD